jgi:hypothetical protein
MLVAKEPAALAGVSDAAVVMATKRTAILEEAGLLTSEATAAYLNTSSSP